MAGDKVNNTDKIRRTTEMMALLLDGLSRQEIFQYTSEKWNITSRQTREYIKWAENRIERIDDNKIKSKIKARYERQYRRAIQSGNEAIARLLLKDMKDLYGIDAPKKHAFTDKDGKESQPLIQITNILEGMDETSLRKLAYKNELKKTTNGKTNGK